MLPSHKVRQHRHLSREVFCSHLFQTKKTQTDLNENLAMGTCRIWSRLKNALFSIVTRSRAPALQLKGVVF